MALSRKHSRAIEVDGEQYRWAISPDSDFYVLVVQLGSGRGTRLEIIVDVDDHPLTEKSSSVGHGSSDQLILTPLLVGELIRSARSIGWEPNSLGAPVELSVVDGHLSVRRGLAL